MKQSEFFSGTHEYESEAELFLPVGGYAKKAAKTMLEHRRTKPPKKLAYSQIFTNFGPV